MAGGTSANYPFALRNHTGIVVVAPPRRLVRVERQLEIIMWTLVIIVLMSGTQGVSGTSSSISWMDFSSKEKCDAAVRLLSSSGTVPVKDANGVFQIRPDCVER